MKVGYYPGCSLEGTGKEYAESLEAIAKSFSIELCEVNDWNCCGSTAAHTLDHALSLSLPARILALAEQQGFSDIIVPCAACYSRLLNAHAEFRKDTKLLKSVVEVIGIPFENKVNLINVIDFIEKYILPTLQEKIKNPFKFKTACYYGCLLVRPPKLVKVERHEDPMQMENIMTKIGATPIDWAFKVECCGAGLSVTRTDVVAKLSGKIIGDAVDRDAEVIIVACPMCHSNLDMRRGDINKQLHTEYKIPVLYITQAIGLSLGLSEKELGIQRHLVPVSLVSH